MRGLRRRRLAACLASLASTALGAVAPSAEAGASNPLPRAGQIAVDGSVVDSALAGDTLYFGGGFGRVWNATGPLVGTGSSGSRVRTPAISGVEPAGGTAPTVWDIEPDGTGGYYAAGSFSHADSRPRSGVLHVLADGSVDPTFQVIVGEALADVFAFGIAGSAPAVTALALDGDQLYIGGTFRTANDRSATGITIVDARTGAVVETPDHPSCMVTGVVTDIVVDGDDIWLTGDLSAGTTQRWPVLRCERATGRIRPWQPDLQGWGRGVTRVGSRLFVAGRLTRADGGAATVVALDVDTGARETDFDVRSTAADAYETADDGAGGLWVGQGDGAAFLHVSQQTGQRLAAQAEIDSGGAYGVRVQDSTLYAAGSFSAGTQHGATLTLDPVTGARRALRDDVDGFGLVAQPVGQAVVTGGRFTGVDPVARSGLAAIDVRTGRVLSWAPELQAPSAGPPYVSWRPSVSQLEVAGDRVTFTGDFGRVNGTPRVSIAAVSATTGAGLPFAQPLAANIRTRILTRMDDALLVGPADLMGAQVAPTVVRLDADTGEPRPLPGQLSGTVRAIATAGTTTYVGGSLDDARVPGTTQRRDLQALDGGWAPIDLFDPRPDAGAGGGINGLLLDGQRLFVTGGFTHIGGLPRRGVAALNPLTGDADLLFDPPDQGNARAIAQDSSELYVTGAAGGESTTVGLDPITGDRTGFAPGAGFESLLAQAGVLVGGGLFTTTPDVPARGLALYGPERAPAPDASTGAVTDIGPTQATFAAVVDVHGRPGGWRIELGPAGGGYDSSWPAADADAGGRDGPQTISTTAPRLVWDREFHYRVVVHTDAGTTYGAERTFRTPPHPPMAATTAATDITTTSATLHGYATTFRGPARFFFRYGQHRDDLEYVTESQPLAASGDVSSPVSGLRPGRLYYSSLVVEDDAGRSPQEDDSSFATLAEPPPPEPWVGNLRATSQPGRTVLDASVNPHGRSTTYAFTVAGDGRERHVPDPAGDAGDGDGYVAVQAVLDEDLPPSTTYTIRLDATNSAGAGIPVEATFTTPPLPPQPPEPRAAPTTEITTTSARLSGFVDPHGSPAKWYFEVEEYPSGRVVERAPAGDGVDISGDGMQPVSVVVDGLVPGASYRVGLYATTATRGVGASGEIFTTLPTFTPDPDPASGTDPGPGDPAPGAGGAPASTPPAPAGTLTPVVTPTASALAPRPGDMTTAPPFGPTISRITLTPRSPRQGHSARVRITTDRAAMVLIVVDRKTTGRLVGGACQAARHRVTKRRCTRWVREAAFAHRAAGGAGQRRLPSSLVRRMRAGRYRIVAIARDPAGRFGAPQLGVFSVRP